jgi:steroid 5-alpha reductase family enzyme
LAPWKLYIYPLLGIAGGTNPEPLGLAAVIGILLFLFGSSMNSYAEYARYVWKRLPENRERPYVQGLFRCSRHPNCFGDLILFSGICLISGTWVTAIIPVLMLAGFVFVNVPVLDSHLHNHYGAAFDE